MLKKCIVYTNNKRTFCENTVTCKCNASSKTDFFLLKMYLSYHKIDLIVIILWFQLVSAGPHHSLEWLCSHMKFCRDCSMSILEEGKLSSPTLFNLQYNHKSSVMCWTASQIFLKASSLRRLSKWRSRTIWINKINKNIYCSNLKVHKKHYKCHYVMFK